jgi:hypothetical protein
MRRPRAHHLHEGVRRHAQSREPIGALPESVRGLLESSGADPNLGNRCGVPVARRWSALSAGAAPCATSSPSPHPFSAPYADYGHRAWVRSVAAGSLPRWGALRDIAAALLVQPYTHDRYTRPDSVHRTRLQRFHREPPAKQVAPMKLLLSAGPAAGKRRRRCRSTSVSAAGHRRAGRSARPRGAAIENPTQFRIPRAQRAMTTCGDGHFRPVQMLPHTIFGCGGTADPGRHARHPEPKEYLRMRNGRLNVPFVLLLGLLASGCAIATPCKIGGCSAQLCADGSRQHLRVARGLRLLPRCRLRAPARRAMRLDRDRVARELLERGWRNMWWDRRQVVRRGHLMRR